tara:strand:- start:4540 stop:6789 length:2250 start_codon:yes stop_codon:yes gene_type:complete
MALTDALQNNFRTVFADSLKKQLDPLSDDNYYFFFGKILPWTDETTPPAVVDSVSEKFSAYRNSLFAIRLDSRNISFVIPRVNWTSGRIYSEYDDTADQNDPDSVTDYYVLVGGKSVYKCIDNNNRSISTQTPTQTGTSIFRLSDGYRWKFMYTITDDQLDFLTEEYMPVTLREKSEDETANLQVEVQQKTVDGSIKRIDVTGLNTVLTNQYPNAISDSKNVFSTTNGGITGVVLDPNDNLYSEDDDAYNGYIYYVSSGLGSGQAHRISDYEVSDLGKELTLETPLERKIFGLADNEGQSSFQILPEILIHGDGESAKFVMPSKELVAINAGRNYTGAFATFPTPGISGDVPTARIFISPKGGHGSNAVKEFNASKILIRLANDNVEGQPEIIDVNDFRQFGILKNPILNDNSLRVAGSEFDRKTSLVIRKPFGYSAGDPNSSFGFDSSTFKVNDYVFGEQSTAVAVVEEWRIDSDNTGGRLFLKNPSKEFILPSTQEERIRINFGASGGTGNFEFSENVTQFNSVLGITANGVVRGWDSTNRELLVRLTATGDGGAVPFSASSTASVVGVSSGAEQHDYANLEDEGGERIATFGTTSGTFTVDAASNAFIGRIKSGINSYINVSETPIYRLTTSIGLIPTSGSFSSSDFSLDAGITQENADKKLSIGKVASWTPSTTGSSGTLVLSDVLGGFSLGGTLSGPNGNNYKVNTIDDSQLVQGSGEVLYIQNVRSIDRQKNQREEVRILIGF